jgi:hypothetical protein
MNSIDPREMKPLTKSEKENILTRLFWDIKLNQIDADKFIEEKIQSIEYSQSQQFFSKVLASCDWYTLLKLLPPAKLHLVLSDPILDRLFPKDLKQKYIYARETLSRRPISFSGQDS